MVFQKRVRDIYINGRLSYLEVVLGSKDFNDFANRVQVLKRIIDADIKLINGIKEERADIASQKDKLEADRAKIVDLEKQAQAKQAEIEQRKQTYAQLLAKARTDQAGSIEKIQELEAASQQVRNIIAQRQAERAAQAAQAAAGGGGGYNWVQGSGALSWPVSSHEITSGFGGALPPNLWPLYLP